MKLFDKTWIAMLMLSAVLVVPTPTQATTPDVIVSEVAWAGSSVSNSDEWIELTNTSSEPVDISDWWLEGAGSGGADLVIPDETHIEPYSTYLISNYDQTHTNTSLGVESNLVSATLSLSNEGFAIHLYDAAGTQIDSSGDGTSPFAGRSGGAQDTDDGRYRSMVRVDRLLDGSLETSWMDAETSVGFIDEATELGTPGTADVWLITPETEEEDAQEVADEEIVEEADEEELPSYEHGTLIISEFVSNPLEDSVEWIEVQNSLDEIVDLGGWTVEDATERQTELGEGALEPGAFLVLENPIGQLNNSGDVIVLKDGTGNVIDQIEYGTEEAPDPDKGQSVALSDGGFAITDTPTPGSENVIEMIEEEIIEEEVVEEEVVEEEAEITDEETEVVEVEVIVLDEVTAEQTETVDETTEEEMVEEPEVTVEAPVEAPIPVSAPPATNKIEDEGYTGPTTLAFQELYPNTSGTDADEEYIVLANTGSEPINLEGWVVQDETGNDHIYANKTLDANSQTTLTRPESGITLNNNGDTLLLISPNGDLIDSIAYEKTKTGEKLVLSNGVWSWVAPENESTEVVAETTPEPTQTATPTPATTPSATNTTPVVTYVSSTPTLSSATSYTAYAQTLTIAEAKTKADGTDVKLGGVVTAAPSVFGKQIMYIQDLTGGIQVYKHDAIFPELNEGDLVSFVGELSTSRGERRVKLSSSTSIKVETGIAIDPTGVSGELTQEMVGLLVTAEGLVHSKSSSTATIEQNSIETTVYFGSGSDLMSELPARGEHVEITGVVTNSNGELRIRPRHADDIILLEDEEQNVLAAGLTGKEDQANMQGTMAWILVLTTTVALGLLALRKYFPAGRKHAPA